MGGAIFTLADFALAIASNTGENPSVSVSSTIEYLSASKGTCLVATCDADKSGRRLGFYTTDITDDTGRRIARVAATVFRRASSATRYETAKGPQPGPFSIMKEGVLLDDP